MTKMCFKPNLATKDGLLLLLGVTNTASKSTHPVVDTAVILKFAWAAVWLVFAELLLKSEKKSNARPMAITMRLLILKQGLKSSRTQTQSKNNNRHNLLNP